MRRQLWALRVRGRNQHVWTRKGIVVHPIRDLTPSDVRASNLGAVTDALRRARVPYFVVRKSSPTLTCVAVRSEEADRALKAVARVLRDTAFYAQVSWRDGGPSESVFPGQLERIRAASVAVVQLWRYYVDPKGTLEYGPRYACELEVWESGPDHTLVAPRPNVVSPVVSEEDAEPADAVVLGQRHPVARVFERKMIDDIEFPIDVVYLWVDGSDAAWQESMRRCAAAEPELHPEAVAPERFRSRDELRYSLRSLDMYAPWVRRIYLVTDGQRPVFLRAEDDRLVVVEHREIASDPALLPVYSSRPILTWIARLPGLSEHFLCMDDDVFFGRDTDPALFFHSNGLGKLFLSRVQRPFSQLSGSDALAVATAKNHRMLLEREFGRSVSFALRHTPHPMLKSVVVEIEERFAEEIERTRQHRFRRPDDIVLTVFHQHYAQLKGLAVPAEIAYEYVNIGERNHERILSRLVAKRDCDVFCLNDVPNTSAEPIPDGTIARFLGKYFPVPSRWEGTSASEFDRARPDPRIHWETP